jgi:hypothetical protein
MQKISDKIYICVYCSFCLKYFRVLNIWDSRMRTAYDPVERDTYL